MWIAIGILVLLFIYLMKRKPTPKPELLEEGKTRVKITVSKMDESPLNSLPSSPNSGSKVVRVAADELEEWFRKNPSLRDANKIDAKED